MKRKLYDVEYVRKLEKLSSKVAVYRELNKSAESKMMLLFKAFMNDNEGISDKFMEFAKSSVDGNDSFKAVINEMDKVGIEISESLRNIN